MRHLVRTPYGVAVVVLERDTLELEERGGFGAVWATAADDTESEAVLEPEAYRAVVKAYLAELYRARHGQEVGTITLNLASHQLLDDLIGWSKLTWRPPP